TQTTPDARADLLPTHHFTDLGTNRQTRHEADREDECPDNAEGVPGEFRRTLTSSPSSLDPLQEPTGAGEILGPDEDAVDLIHRVTAQGPRLLDRPGDDPATLKVIGHEGGVSATIRPVALDPLGWRLMEPVLGLGGPARAGRIRTRPGFAGTGAARVLFRLRRRAASSAGSQRIIHLRPALRASPHRTALSLRGGSSPSLGAVWPRRPLT